MGLATSMMGVGLGQGMASFGKTMMEQTFEDWKLAKRAALEKDMLDYKITKERESEDRKLSPEHIGRVVAAEKVKQQGLIGIKTELAPQAAAADEAVFAAGAPLREKTRAEQLENFKIEFQAKTQAQVEADLARLKNKELQDAETAKAARTAAAGRDPNSAKLAAIQIEAAQLALAEKKAEAKMPAGVKDEIAGLRELLKGKTAIIDKATVDGTATPEGLAKVDAERTRITKRISELRNDYLPEHLREKAAEPAGKNGWDQGSGQVLKDGKPIGTAKSEKEARALFAGEAAKPAKKDDTPTGKEPTPKLVLGRGNAPVRPPPSTGDAGADVRDALGYVADLGQDYDSPQGRASLRERVQEAKSGGKPLSGVERFRAEQMGLLANDKARTAGGAK